MADEFIKFGPGNVEGANCFGYHVVGGEDIVATKHMRLGVTAAFRSLAREGVIPVDRQNKSEAGVWVNRSNNKTLRRVIPDGAPQRIEFSMLDESGEEKRGTKIIVSPVNLYNLVPQKTEGFDDWRKGPYTTGIAAFNFVARKDPETGEFRTTELTPIEDHREVQKALEEMREFSLRANASEVLSHRAIYGPPVE